MTYIMMMVIIIIIVIIINHNHNHNILSCLANNPNPTLIFMVIQYCLIAVHAFWPIIQIIF